MPSPIKSISALAAGAFLAGCAAGPSFKSPAAPALTAYTMRGDDVAAPAMPANAQMQAWWRSFNAPVLNDVMKQAIAGNQDLAAAEATLRAANASEAAARGDAWPQADLNAGAHREQFNLSSFGISSFPGIGAIESPLVNLYSVGTGVSYDLDLFGGRKRRIEGAHARAEAAAARTDAAYLTLTGRVAQTVFDIAALRGEIDAVNAIIEDDRRNVDMVRQAEEAGGAAPAAGLGAKSQLAEDLGELPELKQKLAVARHQLAVLLGKAPAEWAAPDFDLAAFQGAPITPVNVPSELVRRRPDILAAEAELHAATADVGVATAALYPNISLTASITQTALETTDLFRRDASGWVVGGGLTAPLFHGGTLRADKRRAEAQADVALAHYRQAVLTAFMQVADQLAALAHDDEEVAARQAALDSADANLRSSRGGFEKGGVSLLGVLDAQRQRSRAARLFAESQGRRLRDLGLLAVASAAPWREN